jgi:hypothetical protein
LKQFRCLIDAAQHQHLDEPAQRGHHQSGSEDAAPKPESAAHLDGKGRGEIEAEHVEGAVGDVDDAGDTENE